MGNMCSNWLGCCCSFSAGDGGPNGQNDDGLVKQPRPGIRPSSQRTCTDVLLLLLYVGAWVAFVAVLLRASGRGGDPKKILHGVDYLGNTCGQGVNHGLDYAAWVAMPVLPADRDNCPGCYQIFACLSSCSDTTNSSLLVDHYTSTRMLYYCIPTVSSGFSFPYSSDFESASELASRAFVDLFVTWPVILVAPFVAILFAFVYAALARRWAGVLIWFTILLVATGGFLISYVFFKKAKDSDDSTVKDRELAMRVLGYVSAIITGLFLLVVIALRERIKIAVEVVKQASYAVLDMSMLVFFPALPFLVGVGYYALFIVATLLIVSVWTVEWRTMPSYISSKNAALGSQYEHYSWDQSLKNSFAYTFFHLLWTTQFLVYYTYFVIAGAVANWYFSTRDASGKPVRGSSDTELPARPIVASAWRAIRFHLGTIVFGALIIAVIKFVRWVVTYIEAKSRAAQGGQPNPLQRALFCCVKCCLRCIECCMDKVSKNAFVWTAIWGDPFASACCSSFRLIWNNLGRVAAISMVSSYLMLLGQVLVAGVTTGGAAIIIYRAYEDRVNSVVLPLVVIFLLSYMVASMFMSTLETTIDTVFLCFLVDDKCNGAHVALGKLMDSYKDESEAIAAQQKAAAQYQKLPGGGASAAATPMAAVAPGGGAPAQPQFVHPQQGVQPQAQPRA